MRKLLIRENKNGQYNLENFGRGLAGPDGLALFDLMIESRSRHLQLEFPRVTAFDLLTRLNLNAEDFQSDRFFFPEILKVTESMGEIVVEARTGTFYDFLKERGATGQCVLRSPLPIAFYWSGNQQNEVA